MKNLNQENINNLTSLWKQAGMPINAFHEGNDFDYCYVKNSNWPNRLWFKKNVDDENLILAKEKLLLISDKIIVPYWNIYEKDTSDLLEKEGFKNIFEQIGMSTRLSKKYPENSVLEVKTIANKSEALLWTQIFYKAFGYNINPDLLLPDAPHTKILLAYYKSEPVGTGIIHRTGDIAGIHAIGIIPEMRKMGLAESLMRIVLNQSIEDHCTYATLQASEMGKGLYLKLGFEEQFKIRNYILEG